MFCVVILVMHFINVAKATHFRGGTISWNAESGNIVSIVILIYSPVQLIKHNYFNGNMRCIPFSSQIIN